MDKHPLPSEEYGVESCLFADFKAETRRLEVMIDHSWSLLIRIQKLLRSAAKQLKEEKGTSAPAAKRPSKKRK